jgi:hypothetical protein
MIRSPCCSGAAPEEEVSGTVKGFNFDALVSRKPHLKQELASLKDHLLSSDEEEAVKVSSTVFCQGMGLCMCFVQIRGHTGIELLVCL